jgi:hypothetical protein
MIHSRFSFGAHTQLTNRSGDNHRVRHQLDYFQEIALRQCFLQILNSSVRDRLLEATCRFYHHRSGWTNQQRSTSPPAVEQNPKPRRIVQLP